MRSLTLGRRFGGILAWDSFFHLRQDDQRRMFPIKRKVTSAPRVASQLAVAASSALE
jgi:hypothetical protein